MESLVENTVPSQNHKISTSNPELQFSPFSAKLFLQENISLTKLPPSFFQNIPALLVLNLSHTCIQSLPPSISNLSSLEEFILQDCSLLIELPPEIKALKNLKLFDLEGTEIMYLPKEIAKLETLECLRVSLSAYADDHTHRYGIPHIIPRMTILKLTKLKELSISVNPEAEWWEVELLEAVMGDLLFLPDLKTLKLYLPTTKALQQFLRLERDNVPIYSSLRNYRFMTGHCEELLLSLQLDWEENFLKLEKCVKYMNGEGYTDEIGELIRDARALYLRRNWTVEKLSVFDIRRLKYCLLMECNEMQTLVDQEDLYKHKNESTSDGEDGILGSLQYLSIHCLKKLKRISKGPIDRNSLSCLKILALYTCPELTCIFTESLLDNLQSLSEIIVEDCPKVNCLVKLEDDGPWSKGPFFPNLRRVSLLDLPELVSVSDGVCIAPRLDTLLVFNCMKLEYLSVTEIPRETMAIKGEIEWWNALKYGRLTWESVFVQIKRDGSLMDQLAEDTNSLQHFLELETAPSLPVNRNSSRDATEDREDVDQPQIDLNVGLSNETKKMSNQVPSDDGDIWRKHLQDKSLDSSLQRKRTDLVTSTHKIKVSKRIEVKKALDDGYSWRKYGQKEILGSTYPRAYYRCSFRYTHGCGAKKHVQRSAEDPSVFEVCYRGKHTCSTVLHNDGTKSQSLGTAFRMWDPSSAVSGKPDNIDADCVSRAPNKPVSTKKKSRSNDIAEWIQQVKGGPHKGYQVPSDDVRKYLQNESLDSKYPRNINIVPLKHQVKVNKGIEVEEALDDGYIWRKYGEKSVLGAKYPRSYYRCSLTSTNGCCAKKHVQRSAEDPSVFEVCYRGKHTCSTVLSYNCSSTATESASIVTDSHSALAEWRQVPDINEKEYNRCNSCKAEKLVQRRDEDTYKRICTCLGLSVASDFTCESESAFLKPSVAESEATKNRSSTITESTSTITDNSSGLNFAEK